MANFNWLPNEILELIFEHLDFRSRRNLALVCRRWNAVLLSERYIRRHVVLHIAGVRVLNSKCRLERTYPALSINLEPTNGGESLKNLRQLQPNCPEPTYLRLQNQSDDSRLGLICDDQFFSTALVQALHLAGTCKTERGQLCLRLNRLKTLELNATDVGMLRLAAPNLTDLQLMVQSEDHMDFVPQFADQLERLSIVFHSKDNYYFYNLRFHHLRELTIDRRLKGMTRSEQNTSIAFFKRLKLLQKLDLHVKFIDSYVLQTMALSLDGLLDLSLRVCEGTVELVHIGKLKRLRRMEIAASRINLQNVRFTELRWLHLGSTELTSGTYIEGIESLMLFDRLQLLSVTNVKLYPEMLKLTPSYSVQRLILADYKRLEENHLQILMKRFPAIRWLKVTNCHGLSHREIDKLKRLLPRLCIAFDEAKSSRHWLT